MSVVGQGPRRGLRVHARRWEGVTENGKRKEKTIVVPTLAGFVRGVRGDTASCECPRAYEGNEAWAPRLRTKTEEIKANLVCLFVTVLVAKNDSFRHTFLYGWASYVRSHESHQHVRR